MNLSFRSMVKLYLKIKDLINKIHVHTYMFVVIVLSIRSSAENGAVITLKQETIEFESS